MSVFMGQKLRLMIETALGIQEKKTYLEKSEDEFASLEDLCTALQNHSAYQSLRAVPLRAVPLSDQLLEIQSLHEDLVRKRGFPGVAVLRAFASVFGHGTPDELGDGEGGDSDDEDDAGADAAEGRVCRLRFDRELRHIGGDARAARKALATMLHDHCMEYLCLHLDENELPEVTGRFYSLRCLNIFY
jgi:hypothetical protein